MSLMSTLAKVAIGYATARGVDHLGQNGGLGGLLGGAQVPAGDAQAKPNAAADAMSQMPGMDQLKDMMGQMQGAGAQGMGNMQDMLGKLTGGGAGGFDLQSMLGGVMGGTGQAGSGSAGGSGLLSGGGGAGLAGILAMAGGAAASSGQGVAGLLDQFKTAETAETAPQAEEAAGLMLRAMIQAAKSDGDIDAAEKDKILETLGDDADAEDMAFVREQLAAPVDAQALARVTPDAQAMQVYSMSLMSIRVDTQAEARYLDQLAGALGLDQQVVNMLHAQMGVQPLYA